MEEQKDQADEGDYDYELDEDMYVRYEEVKSFLSKKV